MVARVEAGKRGAGRSAIFRRCRWIGMGSFGSATSIAASISWMPGFTRARHIEDQHLFCVNRIVHGPTTAVATANGLVLFDASGQKRQVLGRDQGLIANHVTDVVFNGDGHDRRYAGRVCRLSPDGMRSLYAFHGLVNNHAYALGMVNDRLMAGTLGGLSVLESGTVRVSYTTSNSPLATQLDHSDRSFRARTRLSGRMEPA